MNSYVSLYILLIFHRWLVTSPILHQYCFFHWSSKNITLLDESLFVWLYINSLFITFSPFFQITYMACCWNLFASRNVYFHENLNAHSVNSTLLLKDKAYLKHLNLNIYLNIEANDLMKGKKTILCPQLTVPLCRNGNYIIILTFLSMDFWKNTFQYLFKSDRWRICY